jgi:two-component system OmpR family sensor kinase
MFADSIRWRLQLWLAFLLVCVLSGFGAAVYQLQRVNQLKQIDDELSRRVAALSAALRASRPFGPFPGWPPFRNRPGRSGFNWETNRPPPDFSQNPFPPNGPFEPPPGAEGGGASPGRPSAPPDGRRDPRFGPRDFRLPSDLAALFDDGRSNGLYFAVWSRDGSLIKSSTNAPGNLRIPPRVEDTRTVTRTRDTFREAFHFTEMRDCALVGRSITAHLNAMNRFILLLLAAGGIVLAFGLGGGWWLTDSIIRPVEKISAAASRISAGNLSERISGAGTDNELGRLAGVLNSTFARLEAAFARQKQFTADASHELRTPLAVLISEAQTALARERGADEYRETVEACLDTAQQMRRLTESLLELARFDSGREEVQRPPFNIAENARACVERLRPLADARGVKIECDLAAATIRFNAERFGQVLTNLVTNAIQYNKPGGEVRVSTRAEETDALLVVADNGAGIAAEDLPHIFERFYRADKSRSRAEGRAGLGLAICQAIVEAEGGRIEVSSQPGAGATFTVRLKL